MRQSMEKRKKWPIVLAWWILFISLVAVVAYLSFQSGEDAKELGKQTILQFAESQSEGGLVSQEYLDALTYKIRQSGRVIAFIMIGIVGTITIHISFYKRSWLTQTTVTAVVLVGIAYSTEWLKKYIPSRHYSFEEMMISISAVIVGFVFVSVVTLVFKALKGFFRLVMAGHG